MKFQRLFKGVEGPSRPL